MPGINKVEETFACNVFNDHIMRERLPKNCYKSLKQTKDLGVALDRDVAEVVANAMKDWAIERGATHFTHWFQPMTGITAEKHDAFISPTGDGRAIMEFSGKELIKGEPDASSFPSGGLRSTFEARGYTAWDPTSCAFVKDGTLYIPTAFCSYSGEVLDKKTPLLRSMEICSEQALRILRLFGNHTARRVTTTVGAEQEYFLIDKSHYDQRMDLILTGRTLFGAKAPKGQELEDHYFGNLEQRVSDYMRELDEELWKLGVYAKTKHNEVAPAQHEVAPIFCNSNLAADHNQLTMEMMKKVAVRHGLFCLLQEKPFAGMNGSGKHNNWSMCTDDGQNLLEPGKTPQENFQFLTFLCAIIKGVDEYSDLLRLSVASAGNDHRLGANEAPPAVISIFLGDELSQILDALETGELVKSNADREFVIGVEALPNLPKDTTDRNRTSPFAFTGNKFEFRMLGSADSISCTNVMINTIVAEELSQFADRLERAGDFTAELNKLLKETVQGHKRIIFNGNNYSEEWTQEAERRGLLNLASTVDALPRYLDEKNVRMFEKFKVYTRAEIQSREEILLDNYCKNINIEALTMVDMSRKQILPAVMEYTRDICETLAAKKRAGIAGAGLRPSVEEKLAVRLSALSSSFEEAVCTLESRLSGVKETDTLQKAAEYYHAEVIPAMDGLRALGDELETLVSKKYWPLPTYADMLFNI